MLANDARGNALTAKIIGAAMNVYKDLGAGLREDVYQKALYTELENRGLAVQRQLPINDCVPMTPTPAQADIPTRPVYTSLLVEDQVVIKIKARPHLAPREEINQISSYLHCAQKPFGLLLNFGNSSVYFKRIPRPKN